MSQASELNRRGVMLKQQGEFTAAAACYEQAVELEPSFAEAHFNLGLLRRDLGRVELAVDSLETTATLRPDLPVVLFELGQLYLTQLRWIDAERVFERLRQLEPANLDVAISLAVAWQQQARLPDAAALYQQVLQEQPRHAVALTNLGNIWKAQGKLKEAISCFERAIDADPGLTEAHINLGNSWLESGEFNAAYAEYLVAAALRPKDSQSYVNLGNVLQRLERVKEAAGAYRTAMELDPQQTDAWTYTSHLLKEIGDFEQARIVCEQLSRRASADPIHALRAAATCPLVFESQVEMEEYRGHLETIVRSITAEDWNIEFARWTVYAPECPYNLQFLDGDLRPLKTAFAQAYAPYFSRLNHAAPRRTLRNKPRIGFVVTARHEPAFLKLLGGVVERLQRNRWELLILCSQLGAERIRQGIRRDDVDVVAFPERFDHIVATVQEAACDMLYYWEVGNDPTNYFLPFLRLAPVQVTSWGIQVTTGIPNVDYYLSSDLVEGPNAEEHYSERLVRAATLLTYQTAVALPVRPRTRADFGLSDGQHVYGCVQNLGKFHPEFDATLAAILRRDPDGVVVAARDRNGFAAEKLQRRWQTVMPDVASRIKLLPPLDQSEYLSLLSKCDVLLDPIHFGGVTTTYDAIAVHQPLVTLSTPFHRGRYTAACLRKIGVTDTIAVDLNDYVKIAVDLATDSDRRQNLRHRLRSASREAFEDQRAVGEHERIFEELLARGR